MPKSYGLKSWVVIFVLFWPVCITWLWGFIMKKCNFNGFRPSSKHVLGSRMGVVSSGAGRRTKMLPSWSIWVLGEVRSFKLSGPQSFEPKNPGHLPEEPRLALVARWFMSGVTTLMTFAASWWEWRTNKLCFPWGAPGERPHCGGSNAEASAHAADALGAVVASSLGSASGASSFWGTGRSRSVGHRHNDRCKMKPGTPTADGRYVPWTSSCHGCEVTGSGCCGCCGCCNCGSRRSHWQTASECRWAKDLLANERLFLSKV